MAETAWARDRSKVDVQAGPVASVGSGMRCLFRLASGDNRYGCWRERATSDSGCSSLLARPDGQHSGSRILLVAWGRPPVPGVSPRRCCLAIGVTGLAGVQTLLLERTVPYRTERT